MAGLGSRFKERGFRKIKPLIEIDEEPMIKKAVDSLNIDGKFIFIIRTEENTKELKDYLSNYKKNCKIIEISELTEGSASSCYLAKEFINNDEELIIANCDQYLEWNSEEFLNKTRQKKLDCSVLTYLSNSEKNSFIKFHEDSEKALMIREKEAISNFALVGIHYFKQGNYFVESYEEIFNNKIKFKNEYYVSTACDNMIKKGYNVGHVLLKENESFHCLGTPDDYFNFLKYIGKLNIIPQRLETMFRGWYIGNFEPTVYKTKDFEVGYLLHKKGEIWPVHYHKYTTEVNLLTKGKMILNDLELNENDIFVINKGEIACPIFLEYCYIICIKIPSVPGDKIIL
jgi:dTDP-glucose pyrophosphorylase